LRSDKDMTPNFFFAEFSWAKKSVLYLRCEFSILDKRRNKIISNQKFKENKLKIDFCVASLVAVESPVAEDFVAGGFAHHQTALHRSTRLHGGEEVRGHDRVDLDRHPSSRFGSRALVGGGVVGVRRRRHPHPAGLPLVEGECERNSTFIYRLVHSLSRALARSQSAGHEICRPRATKSQPKREEVRRHNFFSPFLPQWRRCDLSRWYYYYNCANNFIVVISMLLLLSLSLQLYFVTYTP
jgi:hypothetical protein